MLRSLAIATALLTAAPAFAAQAVAVSIEELARESDAVVRGKVTSAKAQRSDAGQIFTMYELKRGAVLKGKPPKVVRIVVPGGVVGRSGMRLDAAPSFTVGEDLVVFLERAGESAYRVTGLAQGKFSIVGELARPDLSSLMFIQTSVAAGERRSEEMPLKELERRVRSTK